MASKDVVLSDRVVADEWAGNNYDVRILARTVTSVDDGDSPYALGTDESIVLVDSSSGGVEIDLPAASDAKGMVLTVKNTAGTNGVTIDGDGSENVDGGATYTDLDAVGDVATFVCDGTEWHLLGNEIA